MRNLGVRRYGMAVSAGFASLSLAGAARAQSCALCYTSVANGGPGAVQALHIGIITLLTPALLLFLGVCGLIVYRARVASISEQSPSFVPASRARFLVSFVRRIMRQRRSASATA